MLRPALFCFVAALAILSFNVIESEAAEARLTPRQNYGRALRQVRQGRQRARAALLTSQVGPYDPALHYLLLLRVVDAAAYYAYKRKLSPEAAYKLALNKDLALTYLNPLNASALLKKDLDLVEDALKPLESLLDKSCKDLDEKDCNLLVELELRRGSQHEVGLKLRAANVLKKAALLSRRYLKLNERLQAAANNLSGLGYALNKLTKLSGLTKLAADTLEAATLLV